MSSIARAAILDILDEVGPLAWSDAIRVISSRLQAGTARVEYTLADMINSRKLATIGGKLVTK